MVKALLDVSEFAQAAAHATRIVDRITPFLTLTVRDGTVDVYACNDRQSSHARVTADTLQEGEITVNGPWLAALAAAMPAGEISLESDDTRLLLRGGDSTLRMRLADPTAAPHPLPEPDHMVDVDSDRFNRLVVSTAHAAGVDRNTPILSAVRLAAHEKQLDASATNRYVAANRTLTVEHLPEGEWLVDGEWLKANMKNVVSLGFGERVLQIRTTNTIDTTVCVDGEYPRLDRLWWTDAGIQPAGRVSVDRQTLLSAARMLKASNFDAKARVVPLTFDEYEGRLRVSFDGTVDDTDSSGYRIIEADVTGHVRTRLDVSYLIGALNALDKPRVDMLIGPERDNGRPRPVILMQKNGKDEVDGGCRQLINPVI